MRSFLLILFLLVLFSPQRDGQIIPDQDQAFGCAPPSALREIPRDANGRFAPVFPGWGHYSYKIATGNDSAQFFFDQGLNLYYSYHLTEALASFKEAARHDSSCLMAYWGQALSLGPYYNGYYYKMPATVIPVMERMDRLASAATGKEKELVEVMKRRYSADTSDGRRKELNRAYAEGLAGLVQQYPADVDLKALYVDAVMLEHTWDFWNNDGTPKPWTMELVSYCDEILKIQPSHPAALHYQIHLVEASLHPEKALHSADVLQTAMPGVAHMVHMSSHMYQRNGLYTKGIEVNDKASKLAVEYDTMARNLKLGLFGLTHYDAVGAYCALNANMYGEALRSANHLRTILGGMYKARLNNPFFQYLYMMPMFVYVRTGKWKMAMEDPAPDSNQHYACLVSEFGKGMASVRLHNLKAASLHLERLRDLMRDSLLAVRIMPFNAPLSGARVAEAILAGELCYAQGRHDEAVRWLEQGVSMENAMIYREPKDWFIPVRHYLGAILLKLGRAAEAEKVYREDLVHNPGNGWSHLGLARSIDAQPKYNGSERYSKEAMSSFAGYMRAFSKAEEIPSASVY